jgi:hypothetical protein
MDTKDKIAIIETLKNDYDHAFISAEGVRHFLAPFEIAGGVETFKDNRNEPKGLTLYGASASAEGQDAATVAEMIASHLGCAHSGMSGRGFRLRAACDAAIAKLKEAC